MVGRPADGYTAEADAVGHPQSPADVGADVVALDHVAGGGTIPGDVDLIESVAGNDVARPGRGAPNEIVVRAVRDGDPGGIGHRKEAVAVEADVVALDHVAGHARAKDGDAV